MKTILVTGGAGFLGSHLCRRLLILGHKVICLDNLSTGKLENIDDMLEHPRFIFFRHDIKEPINVDADEIYNLACPASPKHYQKTPVDTMMTSVMGAYNMLNIAEKTDARILQTSTSEVYGDPLVHPQKEDYRGNVNTAGIRACYDEGKRASEALFFDYCRQYGVDVRVVRLFNVYGPNMDIEDGRVIPNFITQALTNNDITIYGNGTQTRSFCYVEDMVDALMFAMQSNDPIWSVSPINLGDPSEITVSELAEIICHLTGSKSKISYKDLPADDPIRRRPDITKAKEILNWEPKVFLRDGLLATIDYFKDVLN